MPNPETPALALVDALPDDPRQAEETRAKAADIVEDFVTAQALSALDAILAADANGQRADPAVAQDASETSRLVDAEVARFRSLAGAARTP